MTDITSAFNVYIRVKPISNSEESSQNSLIQVINDQITIRDPSPLGDYIVFFITFRAPKNSFLIMYLQIKPLTRPYFVLQYIFLYYRLIN